MSVCITYIHQSKAKLQRDDMDLHSALALFQYNWQVGASSREIADDAGESSCTFASAAAGIVFARLAENIVRKKRFCNNKISDRACNKTFVVLPAYQNL